MKTSEPIEFDRKVFSREGFRYRTRKHKPSPCQKRQSDDNQFSQFCKTLPDHQNLTINSLRSPP